MPWVIGLVCAFLSWGLCFFFFESAYDHVSIEKGGWTASFLNPLIWITTALVLFFFSSALGFLLILTLSGSYLSELARKTYQHFGIGDVGAQNSISKDISNEIFKFALLTPTFIFSALLALLPGIGVISLAIGSWMLAFQFFDIALESKFSGAYSRIKWSLRNWFRLTQFGALAGGLSLMPLFWLLLPPMAVVAASALLAHWPEFQERVEESSSSDLSS